MDSLNDNISLEKMQYAMDNYNPFVRHLGIRLVSVGDDCSETEMVISPGFLNFHRTVHGGALYSLADTTSGIAAIRATGTACVTLNSSVSFLAPVIGEGKITARAKALRWGRRTAVCEVYLYDQNETLCLRGTFTFCPSGKFADEDTFADNQPQTDQEAPAEQH